MSVSRYTFKNNHNPYFMTCTVLHWLPIFTQPQAVNIILDSIRYLQNEGLKLYAWVVLENHIHLIAQSDDLSKDIARFKSHTGKQLLAYLEEKKAKTLLDL